MIHFRHSFNSSPKDEETRERDASARQAETAAGESGPASKPEPESGQKPRHQETLFGKRFSDKEQKNLFLHLVIGIVLVELAVTVGAVVYSIANAQPSLGGGAPRFKFPWIGYTVAVIMVPVLAMLLVNLVGMGFSRASEGDEQSLEDVPQRMRTFFALVRGAPTIILFAGFVLMGAAIYYLDGVMELLLKLGEHFHLVVIWIVGGFTFAWIVSYVVRAWMRYKTRQMEAEYAFRQEVLERTGMVILETKHAPTTELRILPSAPAAPRQKTPTLDVDVAPALPESEREQADSAAKDARPPRPPDSETDIRRRQV